MSWYWVKAIIWTETGAKRQEWKIRPMQIGNLGDPGMYDILHNDHRKLIVPQILLSRFSESKIQSDPITNIQAGTGLLLMRLAHYGNIQVEDDSKKAALASSGMYHKEKKSKPAIIGWRPVTPQTIFMRYNTRDIYYPMKLAYSLALLKQIEANGRPLKTPYADPIIPLQAQAASPSGDSL